MLVMAKIVISGMCVQTALVAHRALQTARRVAVAAQDKDEVDPAAKPDIWETEGMGVATQVCSRRVL